MIKTLAFEDFANLKLDCLIDARSPAEYAQARIKDAINLPSLNDAQHKEIGTLYHSKKHLAKAKGAALMCANMQEHIKYLYEQHKLSSSLGIYCARGGKRSLAQALVLDQIGYKIYLLKGGYKSYRHFINQFFKTQPKIFCINLCGPTGVGKSELLRALSPKIDLEQLANHYGSSFGGVLGPQPSQKSFEDGLYWQIKKAIKEHEFLQKNSKYSKYLNNSDFPPVFIEAESKKIGRLLLPKTLTEAMQAGLHIWCECSLENRIKRIAKDYALVDESFFLAAMDKISPFIAKSQAKLAKDAFFAKDLYSCIKVLLKYYDQSYKPPIKIDKVINTDDIQNATKDLSLYLNLP